MCLDKKIGFMRRIMFVALLVGVSVLLSSCGERTQEKRVYKVGILGGVEAFSFIADGFKAKMAELGYIEGKNILYDVQVANFDPAGLQGVLNRFVEDEVDLIFTFPTEPSLAAKQAIQGTDIPVVFSIAGIEGVDLVQSVRQPGGNITGVRYPGPDLVVKRFEILLELAPHIKRLYIPYDPNYPNGPPSLEALRPIAAAHGVTLIETQVASLEDIRTAFERLAESAGIGIDAIQILPEFITQTPAGWATISEFAKEHRLPLVGSMLSSADNGGVFAYCVDFFEVGQQAAPLVEKVLRGIPAGSIPLTTAEARLRINYKLIKQLGLEVPESLLIEAVEVIH
jgi:putative ABC transport system substrate-binding protein